MPDTLRSAERPSPDHLLEALKAEVYADPIRDHRYTLHSSGVPQMAMWRPLPELKLPDIFRELEQAIRASDIQSLKTIERGLENVARSNILGRVYVESLCSLFRFIGIRTAEIESRQQPSSPDSELNAVAGVVDCTRREL